MLLFDRISVTVIADDNKEKFEIVNVIADDKRLITQRHVNFMAGNLGIKY